MAMWQMSWIYLADDARNSAKMSLLISDLTTFTALYLRSLVTDLNE
jgi:hypothetical protein